MLDALHLVSCYAIGYQLLQFFGISTALSVNVLMRAVPESLFKRLNSIKFELNIVFDTVNINRGQKSVPLETLILSSGWVGFLLLPDLGRVTGAMKSDWQQMKQMFLIS